MANQELYLTRPVFDIQCLTLQYLTDWPSIRAALLVYSPNLNDKEQQNRYQRALGCVRQILLDPTKKISDQHLSEIVEGMINLNTVTVLVDWMGVNLFTFEVLTTLTVEIGGSYIKDRPVEMSTLNRYIKEFYSNELRKQQGHLTIYITPIDIENNDYRLDYLRLTNFPGRLDDYNFMYRHFYTLIEINVANHYHHGLPTTKQLEFYSEIIPNYIINNIDYYYRGQIDSELLKETDKDDEYRYSPNWNVAESLNTIGDPEIIGKMADGFTFSNYQLNSIRVIPEEVRFDQIYQIQGYIFSFLIWTRSFPTLETVEMMNVPSFRHLSGSQFMSIATKVNDALNKINDAINRQGLSATLSIPSLRYFRVFTDKRTVDMITGMFPNLVELYYLVSQIEDTQSIDLLLARLVSLQLLTLFTDKRELADSLGDYYQGNSVIQIRLV